MRKAWLIATSSPNARLAILCVIAAILFATTSLDSLDRGGTTADPTPSWLGQMGSTYRPEQPSLAYPYPGAGETAPASRPDPKDQWGGRADDVTQPPDILGEQSSLPSPPLAPSWFAAPVEAPQTSAPAVENANLGNVLVQEGKYYRRNGDYATAAEKFRTVIATYPGTSEAADAYFALAETYDLDRRFRAAIETLQEFLTQFPDDDRVDRALFFIANGYKAMGDWGGAAYYYEHYAARTDLLRGYAYLNAGESYFQAGDFAKAIRSLENVLEAELPRVPTVDAIARIGDSYFWQRDYGSSIEWYRRALTLARTVDFKADLGYRIGRAYAAMGDVGQAKTAWGEVIENYPTSSYALKAVESLPWGANPPTHFHQGLVYFNNDRYDSAIAAFNEYLARYPDGEDVPRAHYYLGLSYRYQGDYAEALARFDAVASAYPNRNVAGDALWQAGRIAETLSRYDEAIWRYGRAAREYPNSEYAQEAIFRKGLCEYKMADFEAARGTWSVLAGNGAAENAPESVDKARFWLGKLSLQDGEQGSAYSYLEDAAAGDGFYAAKATVLLRGLPTFGQMEATGLAPLAPASSEADSPEERIEFERWLSSWSGRPGYSFHENNLFLKDDLAFRRAEELIRVGSRNEAREEFVELRQKYARDPAALYELAMFFRQNGMYHPSISTALDIANLSPGGSLESAPRFLQKLVYPIYYVELLESEAQRYGIDPLLLAALIRQESAFDHTAESPANAKGLAQVVPSTGQGIARQLGMANFADDDLFKPYVSVAFGAWYLWSQLNSFENNGFHALAAYNAGGGNAGKWLTAQTRADDDLFVEEIAFGETQTYVKSVYRQYREYKRLYDR